MRSDGRFASLRERLLEAGVAPRRVRRYLAELSDHLDDLIRQQQAAGYGGEDGQLRARALLGSDDELAQGWLTDPRLKSFTARAPWAVVPGSLVLFLVLGFLICILAWMGIGFVTGANSEHAKIAPSWFVTLSYVLTLSANFILSPLAALMLAWMVRRQRLHLLWAMLPALALLVFPLFVEMKPHFLSVGLGVPGPLVERALNAKSHSQLPLPVMTLQALLIVAPGLWLAAERHWRRKQARARAI